MEDREKGCRKPSVQKAGRDETEPISAVAPQNTRAAAVSEILGWTRLKKRTVKGMLKKLPIPWNREYSVKAEISRPKSVQTAL